MTGTVTLESALRSSVMGLITERRRLEEELLDMERRLMAQPNPAEGKGKHRMTSNTDLTAERDAIDEQMKALAGQTPERAKKLVEEADKLMEKRDDEFAVLRARRNAIDETFKVSATQAAETEKTERRAARQAAVDDIIALRETILSSSETAEAHLHAAILAIQAAMAAAAEANTLTKRLSGGAWSGFDALALTNFFSAEFARTFRAMWSKPTFGLHCTFREPIAPIRAGNFLATWRERAERETAAAVEAVKGEL